MRTFLGIFGNIQLYSIEWSLIPKYSGWPKYGDAASHSASNDTDCRKKNTGRRVMRSNTQHHNARKNDRSYKIKQLYLWEIRLSKRETWSTTQRHKTELRNGIEEIFELSYVAADPTVSDEMITSKYMNSIIMLPTSPHHTKWTSRITCS